MLEDKGIPHDTAVLERQKVYKELTLLKIEGMKVMTH